MALDTLTLLQSALREIEDKRSLLSEETFQQVVLALQEKIAAENALALDTLNAAAAGDEVRLVTVIFIDVENSTRWAQVLEEDWKALIGDVHRRIGEIIESWDGEIGQYLGDGVLTFFGAHRSRDDDALRAASCALAVLTMIREISPFIQERYAAQLRNASLDQFNIRIGISTGRVVVGVIGSETKREVLAMGSTTIIAARLQQLAPTNQIAIDQQTYLRVRDYFVVQPQAPTLLKGFDLPIEYYLLMERQSGVQLTNDHVSGILLPFVGRDDEMLLLRRMGEEATRTRRLGAVILYGEAGVGKSRLLQEAIAHADAAFHTITLVGRYERRMVAHSLLHDLIGAMCGLNEGTPTDVIEARIVQLVQETWSSADPDAAAILGSLAGFGFAGFRPPAGVLPLDVAARWLWALTGDKPLLLVIDNLEWVDLASLDLLEQIALVGRERHGLIIAAGRMEDQQRRATFMQGIALVVTLTRLSDEATMQLVDAVVRYVDNVPGVLPRHICERAAGNPLFVEEFLRMLFDSRIFEPTKDGRWKTNNFIYGMMATTLPQGLMGVFQARLDDLSPVLRRVVQIAAVFGQTFWEAGVTALCGFDAAPLLVELEERGIVVAVADGAFDGEHEYAFRHALFRDVGYGMLTRSDREVYHQRAAEWLALRIDGHPDYLATLAEHLSAGQLREQALTVYLAAAEARLQAGTPTKTLKLVEAGLAQVRDVPRETALPLASQLWLVQGMALVALERYDEASAAGQSALRLMSELPPDWQPERRTQAARVIEAAAKRVPR